MKLGTPDCSRKRAREDDDRASHQQSAPELCASSADAPSRCRTCPQVQEIGWGMPVHTRCTLQARRRWPCQRGTPASLGKTDTAQQRQRRFHPPHSGNHIEQVNAQLIQHRLAQKNPAPDSCTPTLMVRDLSSDRSLYVDTNACAWVPDTLMPYSEPARTLLVPSKPPM